MLTLIAPSTIRGCSVCIAKKERYMATIRYATTIASSSSRRSYARGRLKPPTTNPSASAQIKQSATPFKHTTKHNSKRRKATLAGEATGNSTASTTSSIPRNLRKELIERLADFLGKPRTLPIPRWVSPKHYSITFSECAGHLSFILVATSYAVDDFLWLRIIAVAGSTSMLFFTYFHPHGRVLWLPWRWNCLFIALNGLKIARHVAEGYVAEQLSNEMLETRSKHFYLMDPVDFSRLCRAGTVKTYNKGDFVIQQDEPNSHVYLVLSGRCKVLRDGGLTYGLDEGNFIAESGLHAGLMLPDSVDSCCTIVAENDVRLLCWQRSDLIDLLDRTPHLRRGLKAVLSWDIVRKLKAQRIMLANGEIQDTEAWTHRRHEQTEHRYTAILKNLLEHPSQLEKRKKELTKYRTIHHIDDEHHRDALKECGWTMEEFERGYKGDEDPMKMFHSNDRHGPGWYFREMIVRIVG